MRVVDMEVNPPSIPDVRGLATYTRRPAGTTLAYASVARPLPEPATSSASHVVAPGENLTRIVREHLMASGGRPANADVYEGVGIVARDNGLRNPDLIHPGMRLDLSGLSRRADGSAAPDNQNQSPPVAVGHTAAPHGTLLDVRPLAAPASVAAPTSRQTVPVDVLRDATEGAPTGEPLRISRSSAAALTAPPSPQLAALPQAHRGATGGPGPVPSDAVIALQRLLNGTSNALHTLRGLMDGDAPPATPDGGGPWASLVRGTARLSSEYGMRKDPFTGRMAFHGGVDLAVKRGTDITAVRDGVVAHSGWKGGYGNTVVLRHDGGLETVYAHAARTHVLPGQLVKAGDHIADAGSSGRSTGPHVHFEVREHGRAVNPMPYLE